MPFPTYQLLIAAFVIALLSTLIGFKKTVWFISLGYTLAIVALAFLLIILFYPYFHLHNWLQALGLTLWGTRLGAFLYQRERSDSYRNAIKETTDQSQSLPFTTKAAIWLAVSLLYVCMFSPALFASLKNSAAGFPLVAGLVIMYAGLILEGVSDRQKSIYKVSHPNSFCNTGLFSWVRSPNYLGEILFWTGNFVIGLPFYVEWWHWGISMLGLIAIILIMIGSTKRLEAKQLQRYGSDPVFQKYIQSVPVLFPWLPVYSLKNVKVYLE